MQLEQVFSLFAYYYHVPIVSQHRTRIPTLFHERRHPFLHARYNGGYKETMLYRVRTEEASNFN